MKNLTPAILLAIVSSVAAAAPSIRIDRKIAASPDGAVRIVNVSGSIAVIGNAANEVQVTGVIGKTVERVDVVNEGGTIVVRVVLPKGVNYYSDGDANLTIRVPGGSRLETSTVSADQSVQGISGAVQLSAVSGDMNATLASPDVQIKTVSGDLNLTGNGKPAKWRVTTVSGDVILSRGAGSMELSTVSGDAQVTLDALTALRARTTSGDMQLRGRLLKGADVNFESVSGDLNLTMGSEAGVTIDAETFSGDIRTCFGVQGKPVGEYSPGEKLNTRHGDGGAHLRIKTLSGDVTLCDRS